MTKHPDDKIDERYAKKMNELAHALDETFNGTKKGEDRDVCFVLLTTEFKDDRGRVNYIANGNRQDIILMLKHLLARFEGQPDIKGRA